VLFVDNGGNLRGLGWSSGGTGWTVDLANPIATNITPGASLASISRESASVDVFFVGKDGGVWQMSVDGLLSSWVESEVTGTVGLAKPGSPIAATTRSWAAMDVFFTDTSGNLRQASLDRHDSIGRRQWRAVSARGNN
jgi:hypothetical protein